jgi:leader peptidase (prepilin peptidase)/N-methyltransferase
VLFIKALVLAPIFLCWGSFLNVVAYRALRRTSLFPPSTCPHCDSPLPWHHLVPLLSWLMLKGCCSFCKEPISWLYPLIEFITAIAFVGLFATTNFSYLPAYSLFFSALIVTIRTDLEAFLIMSLMTLWIIPLGLLASTLHWLPISLFSSALGALIGAVFLWAVRKSFWLLREQEGLGLGDIELLAAIGSFIGPFGVLITLLIGSLLGTLIGLGVLTFTTTKDSVKLPFGAFLAFGALIFVIFQKPLTGLLF